MQCSSRQLQRLWAPQCLSIANTSWALQAILADNADGRGLDVELAASGFGQQHQEVILTPPNWHHLLQPSPSPPPDFACTSAAPILFTPPALPVTPIPHALKLPHYALLSTCYASPGPVLSLLHPSPPPTLHFALLLHCSWMCAQPTARTCLWSNMTQENRIHFASLIMTPQPDC